MEIEPADNEHHFLKLIPPLYQKIISLASLDFWLTLLYIMDITLVSRGDTMYAVDTIQVFITLTPNLNHVAEILQRAKEQEKTHPKGHRGVPGPHMKFVLVDEHNWSKFLNFLLEEGGAALNLGNLHASARNNLHHFPTAVRPELAKAA